MGYKIKTSEIKGIISRTNFSNDGDDYEKAYWPFLKDSFSGCEIYWRHFIVPDTKRIELEVTDPSERIRPREGISEDIQEIASIHYSMFMNLVYSYDHLQNFRLSSFEDFYIHLVSACDLAEEFLIKTYFLTLECKRQETKEYENYLNKGEKVLRHLNIRKDILNESFKDSEDWKEYKSYTKMIRDYRNIIAHYIQIGKIFIDGKPLVPKKERIQDYKKWAYVFAVLEDTHKLKNDFIDMMEQMNSDIQDLENILNKLWEKPVTDLKRLFFDEKNEILLKKYNIELV